jgi:two-component system, cell cycle sensor histidine kinase and response regulator CckA
LDFLKNSALFLRDFLVIAQEIYANIGISAPDYAELTVTDNGPGIDPATIENIFESYFTTKGVGETTGMGLVMVKGIIESYGGDIRVTSEPGKKTSFIIRLPVATGRSSDSIITKEYADCRT